MRQWKTITASMVGHYLEGFGYVLKKDVGKRYFVEDGSAFVESDSQRDLRLGKKQNPSTSPTAVTMKKVGGKFKVEVGGTEVASFPTEAQARGYAIGLMKAHRTKHSALGQIIPPFHVRVRGGK